MIFETTDATLLNLIVNKPEVRGSFGLQIKDPSPLDFTEMAERDDYKIITNGIDAFMIADELSPVAFHCHSVFDTTCRGRNAVKQGKEIIQWMWDNTPAIMLLGATPVENKAARLFNRWVGFTSDGTSYFQAHNNTYLAEWFHIMRPGSSN